MLNPLFFFMFFRLEATQAEKNAQRQSKKDADKQTPKPARDLAAKYFGEYLNNDLYKL